MSHQSNGKTSYEKLCEQDLKIGLGSNPLDTIKIDQLDPYLNISVDALNKLTGDEAAEKAHILAKISFALQRVLNKKKAIQNQILNEFNLYINSNLTQYKGNFRTYEEQKALLISNDSNAKDLYIKYNDASLEVDNLFEIPNRIDRLARTLENIAYSRRKKF